MTQHKDKIIELYESGMSYKQIKEQLGCSLGTISYHVGQGQKDKTRSRSRKTINAIRKYIQEYKQSKVCADCKENYPYWIMEFDHLGNKEFTIGRFKAKTHDIEKVKLEIEKCEVVCSNCHKNRTHQRLQTTGSSVLDVDEFYE